MTNTEMINTILPAVKELAVVVLWAIFLRYLVPWMKGVGLFAKICTYVLAYEKMANAGAIPKVDKKKMVLQKLSDQNIEVTPHVDALIEAAVEILDILTMKILKYFTSAAAKPEEPFNVEGITNEIHEEEVRETEPDEVQ